MIRSLPELTGINRIPIIDDKVDVYRDKWGIPHIYAQNRKDLYRVLGYMMASERLFQMDIYRRSANGTLSEVLGEKGLPYDIRAKAFGLQITAKRLFQKHKDLFSTEMLEMSAAFYEGVNYFIDKRELPYEFGLLGYRPEHFSLEDAQAFIGLMGLGFSEAFKQDLLLQKISKRDPKLVNLLTGKKVDPPQTTLNLDDQAYSRLISMINSSPIIFEGSNSWVISGKRTKSGKPILANDPHIRFSMPGIWFEAHLHSPDFEMYGHFIPIIPFAILGHNQHKGWAFTMSMVDDIDFYKEKIDYDRQRVMYKGKWEDLKYEDYVINIRGGTKRLLRIPYTPHGPVIDAIWGEFEGGTTSIAWSYLDKDNRSFQSLYEMNLAKNLTEFQEALRKGASPGLNISYVDRDNNIGWWIYGKIPMRPQGCDGRFVHSGSDGKCDYLGYMNFDQHPHLVNPPSGIIVSANSIPPEGADRVPGDWRPLDRYDTIRELINRVEKHDVESTKQIQTANDNQYNLVVSQKMIQLLDHQKRASRLEKTALLLLKRWNGKADGDSIGMSIYSTFLRFLSQNFFDELTHDEYSGFADLSICYIQLKKALNDLSNPLWKDTHTPNTTPQEVVDLSFTQAVEYLNRRLGPVVEYWNWSNLHNITFEHPLGKIPLVGTLFNYGPLPINGAKRHINAIFSRFATLDFHVKGGVSTRRIIDYSNPLVSYGVLPLGESAHLLSRHLDDQYPLFANGKYRYQLMDSNKIKSHIEGKLQFLPLKK